MADPIFYVGSEKDKQFTSFVPAKFLTRDGSYIADPTPGGSQNAYLYSNIRGDNKTDGRSANPNNYLIVPANYSERQGRDFANQIARIVSRVYPEDEMGAAGLHQALGQMTAAFLPGGSQDLQRHPQWGIPNGSVVPAFVGSASNHLGYVTGVAGLPMDWSEIGGGAANGANAVWQSVKRLIPFTDSVHINTDGAYWLSKQNEANIAHGYAAGVAANNSPAPFNDYGYGAQFQAPPSQIGNVNGISPFSATLAGIDPDEPAPPVWPPQASAPVRYLSSQRVRY
jgi:hypothetical protein